MRGRSDYRGSLSLVRNRYARAGRPIRGRSIAWLTSLLLFVSLMAPYVTIQTSLATPDQSGGTAGPSVQQRQNTPPPLEGVFSVAVGGDVAQLVGNVALSPTGDGMWVGSAALNPGSYSYQIIVATNTGAVTLGQNGLESPPANQATLTVPDGAQAATFVFNEFTGAVNAGGTVFEIQTDVGQFQMLPAPQGTYEVFFNSPADTPITIQPLAFGTPTGESAQATAGDSGRIHVALNAAGQIQVAEAVQTATLEILKTDQNGNPLGGACFTAYGGGDVVAGQACDSADGANDGAMSITFANGLPDGNVDIVESFTPEGQVVSDPQQIDLSSGAQQLQMVAQVAGEEPPAEETPAGEPPAEETPADQPPAEEPPAEGGFTLTFFAVDLNGSSLPGACFAIDGGEPVCDDDGDGSVIIPNVQPGTRTLSEPRSPEGFEPYPDIQIEVTRDEQFSVPHNPGVSAQLPDETANVSFQSVDADGNLLPSACYQLDTGASACDEDGDGITSFEGLANGSYSVTQTQTPEGFQPVEPFTLEVTGSGDVQIPHQTAAEPEATQTPEAPEEPVGFTIGFVSVDEDQNGLPFACYSLDGGDPLCDDDGDGVVTFEAVPAGLHTLTQTQQPEGFENVGSVEVNVEQDANFAVRHTATAVPEEPEPTPTEEGAPPGLTVGFVSVDEDDNGLPGACFTLDGGDEVCDDDGDAEVTFTGVQPGTHSLTQTQAPEGYDNVGTLELDLQNDGRFAIRHQTSAIEEESTPLAETGQIVARTIDQDGNLLPEVCYELSEFGQQCDGDDEDADMTQEDVPAGEYTVALIVPEGYEIVGEPSQTVTVVAGESVEVQFQVQVVSEPPAEETPEETPEVPVEGAGAIAAVAVEEGFPILDACIAFEGPATGEVCDNQEGDSDPAQGSVLIANLPAGSYQVAMPNPPAGFDPAPAIAAEVADGETATVQLEVGGAPQEPEPTATSAPESGNLSITKIDPDGNPLAGACFQIGDGAPVCDNGEGDTDGLEGVIRIEGIPAGDQTVTETTAPEGYEVAAPGTVSIEAGTDVQVQVVNEIASQPLSTFRVIMREPDGSRLSSTCIALIAADGSTLGPYCDDAEGDIDDRNGVIEILDTPVGDYTVTVTTVPAGYIAGPDSPMTIVEGERAEVTIMNELATGTLVIAKVDQNGSALGGACFLVGEVEYCDDGESDVNAEPGIVQIEGLAAGSVTITESVAPEGFVIATEPQTVEVVANETASASFVNSPSSGSLQITKTDEGGQPLEGACFLVGETEYCDNGEGDESPDIGALLISGLPAGPVTVTESVAPAGYVIATEPQTVEVAASDTASASFVNGLASGSLQINKTDEGGQPLEGACFLVGETEYCDNGDSDESPDAGAVLISGLPVGPVTVTESIAPAGYVIATEPQSVEIVANDTASATFVNGPATGSLQINKTDEGGQPLEGACFLVGETEYCDNGEGDESPDSGAVLISGLPAGPITVTESIAPAGYIIATEPQTVEVVANETASASFVNAPATGSLQITKSDEGGQPLEGACFLVGETEYCDNDEVDESPDTGAILISGLPAGPVTVTESVAPGGYVIATEPQTVEVVSNDTVSASFVNVLISGSLLITKTDEGGELLEGACFFVGETEYCDNGESDQNPDTGSLLIGGLPAGSVTVTESVAPAGYAIADEPQTAEIVADDTIGLDFADRLLSGTVVIRKTDESGAPLAGACFSIDGQDVCDNGAGDANAEEGVLEVSGIPAGDVTVSETTPPAGYGGAEEGQTVTIADGEAVEISFVNARLIGSLRIEKTDETGAPLGGACFTIAGTEICDNGDGDTNGDEAVIEIGGLGAGSIEIVESIAPDGYAAAETQIVEIVANETATVVIANVRQTGTVQIVTASEGGTPLGGACYQVDATEVCDDLEGDESGDSGVVAVGGVPTGDVTITQTLAPEGFGLIADPQTVTVGADETSNIDFGNVALVGGLRIEKVDETGAPVGGACFAIGAQRICDNDGADLNSESGIIELSGLPIGPLSISETSVPEGYSSDGVSQTVQIVAEQTATTAFVNTRLTGSVRIDKVDQDGAPLGGACFAIGELAVCDDGEGDTNTEPGVIEVAGVPIGAVTVSETSAPEGYGADGTAQTIDISNGETTPLTMVNTRLLGSVRIEKIDQDGELLAGACFSVGGQEVCDNGDGDTNSDDGVIEVGGIPVGPADVTETSAPEGYAPTGGTTVQVAADEVTTVSMSNVRLLGGVRVLKIDENGEPLAGSCFSVAGTEVCDNSESDLSPDDGIIEFAGIPTGTVDVAESSAPDGYVIAEPVSVDVVADSAVEVTIANALAAGSVSISKIDQDGNPLAGACFTVGELAEVCDNGDGDLNGDDGVIEIGSIPAGEVAVTESTVPGGYAGGEAQTVTVPPGDTATASFVNVRQLGGLSITKTDQDGNPLPGACFTVGELAEVCDNGEGDLNSDDGLIEMANVPVGEVNVVETTPPAGYAGAGDQNVVVVDGETATASFVNERQLGGLSITKTDEEGNPLAGSCFTVGALAEICDNGEGDLNGDDGVIVINDVPVGEVNVIESTPPTGYAGGDPQLVAVAVGETTGVSFINIRQFGGLSITKTDQDGNPLAGACFTAGDLAEVCDNSEGDLNGEDGVIEIANVPAGEVTVAESTVPDGYAGGDAQTVTVIGDESATASFVNARQLGNVSITKTDQDGNLLAGACFTAGDLAEVCDNSEGDLNSDDGVIEIADVPVGEVSVTESTAPNGYAGGGAQTITVAVGETATATFVNDRQLGALSVTKTDQDGNPLTGACFTVGALTEVCDNGEGDLNGEDGIIDIDNVPVGEASVAESTVPEGYAGGEAQTVTVIDGETATASFVNNRQLGGLSITKTDQDGNPLAGACFTAGNLAEVCDNSEGDLNGDDGIIEIADVPVGEVTVAESTVPDSYVGGDAQTVTIIDGETATASFVNVRQLGNVSITKTDQDGNPLAGACFTAGDLAEVCDNSEGDLNSDDGLIEIADVPVGDINVVESTTPEGFAGGEAQTVTVINGETASAAFVNVRQIGDLTINKTDESGDPLEGSCFTVGDLGEICDNGEGDENPETGIVSISDIASGSVEVVESTAPAGYASGAPQTADVPASDSVELTFVNTRILGTLTIVKTDGDGNPLEGSCFTVGDRDPVCDNGDGDFDETAGRIALDSIPVGPVTVVESTTPDGYVPAADQTVEVIEEETLTITVVNERMTGTLTVTKVDEIGAAVEGACFTIGDIEVCDGGEGDGVETPGVIEISGIPTGSVEVSESTVPEGYTGEESQSVEISADEPATLSFVNTRLTGGVTINKNNEDGDPQGGACFTIGDITVCDNDDVDLDETEGVIAVEGVPIGAVDITETSAPEGYSVAAPQSIDVIQGESASVVFVNSLQTGSVQILKTDAEGQPLAGACFLVDGQELCDGGEGDESDTEGTILVTEIEIGPIVVSETSAPEGYSLAAEAQTVEIQFDAIVDVTFVNNIAVGMVSISKTDQDGEPLGGACFTIGETAVCDNQEGDSNPADGTIDLVDVPVGTVDIAETSAPENYVAAEESESVEVVEGETATVTIINTLAVGSLSITKTDDAGLLLADACFTVDAGEPVCDNGEGDQNPNDGIVDIDAVPVGGHSIAESQAPEGYVGAAEPQTVEIALGETATVSFTNEQAVGTIRILKTADDTGEPLGGACFAIDGGDPVCDDAEGDTDSAEGTIAIVATVGDHTVTETQSPEGYDALTPATSVTVSLGETVEVPFVNTRFTGSVRIVKTDNLTGEFLIGACFSLDGVSSYGPICDNAEGDADPADGVLLIQSIDPGVYTVTETTTPEGYAEPDGPVADNVVVDGGAVTDLQVENVPEGLGVRPIVPPGGTLEISSIDEAGEPVGGACFSLSGATEVGPVCDDDLADLDPEVGAIEIGTIPTGSYTLTETTTPAGFATSAPQTIEIGLNETTSIEIVHGVTPVEPGDLLIRTFDAEGNAVGGACFRWSTGSQCDNLSGDADPAVGQILVTGLAPGDYTITGTEPPAGMLLAEAQNVTIAAGEEASLDFTFEAAPEETGGLEFQLNDDDGNPVEGACLALSEASNTAEDLVFCDGGEEDTNPDPGVLVVENLPVGTYSVRQTAIPGSETAEVADLSFKMQVGETTTLLQEVPEKTVQVKPNVIVIVIIIIIVEPPQTGALDIVKRSEDTNIVQTGACFRVTGQGNDIEICDNDGVNTNLTLGVIRFVNLPTGVFNVSETQSPPGYDPAEDSEVAIVGGLVTTITVHNPPTENPIGDLTVLKVDPEGEPISGTCFEIREDLDIIAGPICDEDDGDDDGTIVFSDLAAGNFVLRETQAASSDYQPVADQPVTVVAGVNTDVPVVNSLKPGSILITKLDDEGNGPLAGACFGLDRGSGIEFEVCDQQTGDGDLEEGIIQMNNIPPGAYDLVETAAPVGFDPGPAIPVTVEPATQLLLEVENTPSVPPTDTGDLTVIKRNSKGEPLPGACFALRQGAVIRVAPRCDADDGNLDGEISFVDVGVGQYGIIETKKPSADYQTPPEKFVTITKDAQIDIVIVNVLKPGRIQITKVNQQDQPLANACFTVSPGFFAQKCTNGSGQVVFDNLPPGVYTITETQAPYGYLPAPPVTNVVVNPGLTTPVKIVNQKAPPPPDAGSLRVIKFFCPLLGNSEELWSIYDSSDANTKVLAQTANCKKGDATFVLKPTTPGDLVSIKFVTGPDGIAHLTLPAGTYTLTELGTGVTTQVQVFVSQQTTVVVLNYIPKPDPTPARINVYKYTCDPGFQGQFYLDFIGACGATENLTNNVTFRISGAANASGVTGDGGQRGRTLFTQLPSGLYLLREETAGNGQVYMWCGLQLDSFEFGAIGNQIAFPLQLGETMYCAAFNVPDLVTDTTGSLVVQKYSCELPPTKRPPNFDWFAECGPQSTGAKFGLSELVDGVFVPRLTGLTNVNGLLTFDGLKSGTYKLQEIGGDWCHAESDSVNATGDVIVRAGQRSNVWIFNCVPTVEPPNTGAGTTAGSLHDSTGSIGSGDSQSPASALLIWPVLALAGIAVRRQLLGRRAA